MEMNKPVYCQKPLAHHVSEVRAMRKIAEEKKKRDEKKQVIESVGHHTRKKRKNPWFHQDLGGEQRERPMLSL